MKSISPETAKHANQKVVFIEMTSELFLKCLPSSGRQITLTHRSYSKKTTPGSRYVKPLVGIKEYLVQKCFSFIRSYESILEKKFPRAFKVYQVFSVGTKELYIDAKDYIRISQELMSGKAVRDLTRRELEIYFQVPKDLMKVSPTLVIAALPFANYVIFPLAYAFPKQLLSSQFWSLQQKLDFALKSQKSKLLHFRPVFRIIQAKVKNVDDSNLKELCSNIFYTIGSGAHPSVSEIIEVKPLFENPPFSLYSLTSMHLVGLCKMHGLRTNWGKRHRLWSHAGIVREMDLAILREGLQDMTLEELRKTCFLRGLNPVGQNKEEILVWLQQWIDVSQTLDRNSLSLLLHLPLFLAYNRPSNWGLIH